MKKVCAMLILSLVILSIIVISPFITNVVNDTTPQLDDDIYELSFSNLQALLQLESVPIMNNKDPGKDPAKDFFGVLGKLVYPLKNLNILESDEVVIIIQPSPAVKTEKFDAYVAYNTKKTQQSKDEFCYFQTPRGTTPVFYLSIYINGVAIIKETGIFGAHLSQLTDEFKPVNLSNINEDKGEDKGTVLLS